MRISTDMGTLMSKLFRLSLFIEDDSGIDQIDPRTLSWEGIYDLESSQGLDKVFYKTWPTIAAPPDPDILKSRISAPCRLEIQYKPSKNLNLWHSKWQFKYIRGKSQETFIFSLPPNGKAIRRVQKSPANNHKLEFLVQVNSELTKLVFFHPTSPNGELQIEIDFDTINGTVSRISKVERTRVKAIEFFKRRITV